MNFDKCFAWVPLLGIVMSENEMLFRMYSPSVVNNSWKIAEINVMKCNITAENFQRLLHIMVKWTEHCARFLCSLSFVKSSDQRINPHLLLHRNCNVTEFGSKIFKAYDYRRISARSSVIQDNRCDNSLYRMSDLKSFELAVDWTSSDDQEDTLQIISYNKVPGVHRPSVVGHMILILRKIAQLHANDIVHGDLRFANIVFSDSSDAAVEAVSTIIDFDYSGKAGEKVYPRTFNLNIRDGFRHSGVRELELLHTEHDIAALQWMWAQYRPKNAELRETWSSCMSALMEENGLLDVAAHLEAHKAEELEPVDNNMEFNIRVKGTGSSGIK